MLIHLDNWWLSASKLSLDLKLNEMIRVYCDSNVFRMLKPTSRQFNQQIFDFFENIRRNAVIVFSETHLDDLRHSDEVYRNQDLKLMESYADTLHLRYDHIDKKCLFEVVSPTDAFKIQNYDVYDKVLQNPLDLRTMINNIDDLPDREILMSAVDQVLMMPIPGIGYNADGTINSFENINAINKIIPNNSSTITLDRILTDIQPCVNSLLNDPGKFDELRKKAIENLNTKEYNYDNWGLLFDEKLEKSPIGKKYTDILRLLINDHNAKDHWYQFQFAYYILELLGITTEKSGGRRKKNSLIDLSTDCSHAFNAINCDFFITNDKGLYDKCDILYHVFQINDTQLVHVSKLGDLQISQDVDFSYSELIESLLALNQPDLENENTSTYKLKYPFLHYFDRVAKQKDMNDRFVLYSSRDCGRSFVYREIAFVYNKLVDLLPGIEGVEHLTESELSMESVPRNQVWIYPSAHVGICINRDLGAITLSIDMSRENRAQNMG